MYDSWTIAIFLWSKFIVGRFKESDDSNDNLEILIIRYEGNSC